MKTTIKNKTILLSRKGMKELKKAIIQLEHYKQEILLVLRELDKTPSRDENLTRIDKLSDLETVEFELAEKKLILSNAIPLKSGRTRLQVAIGSIVDLIDKQGRRFRYMIVNSIEADPSNGRISTVSPIGQQLIGKTVSDVVEWGNGTKVRQFQLIRIS